MRVAPQLRALSKKQLLAGIAAGRLFYDARHNAIVPFLSGAAQATNTFEAGTQGATIATSDTGSGNPWDSVTISAGGTLTYDNAHIYGTRAAKIVTPSSGSTGTYLGWLNATLGAIASAYGRIYLYRTNNPGSVQYPLMWRSSGSARAFISINTAGKVELRNAAQAVSFTSTASIGLNQWVRLEPHIVFSGSVGHFSCDLFNNPDSTTATETIGDQTTNLNLGGATANELLIGDVTGIISQTFWVDEIVWGSATPVGPYTTSAIAFDAASSSAYEPAVSTYSWAHTCSGASRILTVGVSIFAAGTVSGITYNGVALTFLGAVTNGAYRSELWYLVAPATGSNTIAVTLSASLTSIANAVSYTGVNQGAPFSANATATGTGNPASLALTPGFDQDWTVDVISTSDTAITVGGGQTSRANNTGALGSGAMSDEGPITPPASTTMQWTNVGVTDTWAYIVAALDAMPAWDRVTAAYLPYSPTQIEFPSRWLMGFGAPTPDLVWSSLTQATVPANAIGNIIPANRTAFPALGANPTLVWSGLTRATSPASALGNIIPANRTAFPAPGAGSPSVPTSGPSSRPLLGVGR